MTLKINCHICDGKLTIFEDYNNFCQVSSDCKPVKSVSTLAICSACSNVQKEISADWEKQTNFIYSNYSVYSQSSGEEQVTFSASDGTNLKRSEKFINWISKIINPPIQGTVLDIGCGNGSFINEFGKYFSKWNKIGYELNEINRDVIEKIPNTKFYSGSLNGINDKVDLITLIHCLEHITNPIQFLHEIKLLVHPETYIFFQVPNLETSPFDILISDHCTHFSLQTLKNIISYSGFDIISATDSVVSKELSLIAKLSERKNKKFSLNKEYYQKNISLVNQHMEYLDIIKKIPRESDYQIGIFGSSISATWLFSELNKKVDFFVDEDESRINNSHLSVPIISTDNIPHNSALYFPLKAEIVDQITKRIKFHDSVNILTP